MNSFNTVFLWFLFNNISDNNLMRVMISRVIKPMDLPRIFQLLYPALRLKIQRDVGKWKHVCIVRNQCVSVKKKHQKTENCNSYWYIGYLLIFFCKKILYLVSGSMLHEHFDFPNN